MPIDILIDAYKRIRLLDILIDMCLCHTLAPQKHQACQKEINYNYKVTVYQFT